ncbi:hypothetical protein E3N88_16150 [Mikania micrantha]|uniref:Uncharacterized protein n=1 Tax=Mikania micrantha TaxID=192012 RepID=A0A5N6NXG3_9ASTR|nr:hypothetical protein E3N88_16150 [Mikania micrantha]
MSEGNGKGKGIFGIFGQKKTSSKSHSGSRGSEEGPSRRRLSQEPDASGYCTAIPSGSRQRQSPTPAVNVPQATRGRRSIGARMTTQMPVIEWFEAPRNLIEFTHTPPTPSEDEEPYEESEAPTHIVISDDDTQGVAADSLPLPVLSDDQTEVVEHTSAQKESTHMSEEYEQDSPDESVPMEFLMNDEPRRTRNPEPSSRRTHRRHGEHDMADSRRRSGERFGQSRDVLEQTDALWQSFEEEHRRQHAMYQPPPPVYQPTPPIMYQVPPVYPQMSVYQPMPTYVPAPTYPQPPMYQSPPLVGYPYPSFGYPTPAYPMYPSPPAYAPPYPHYQQTVPYPHYQPYPKPHRESFEAGPSSRPHVREPSRRSTGTRLDDRGEGSSRRRDTRFRGDDDIRRRL